MVDSSAQSVCIFKEISLEKSVVATPKSPVLKQYTFLYVEINLSLSTSVDYSSLLNKPNDLIYKLHTKTLISYILTIILVGNLRDSIFKLKIRYN